MKDMVYGYVMANSKSDQKIIFDSMVKELNLLKKKKEILAKKSFEEMVSFIKELKQTIADFGELSEEEQERANLPIDVLLEDFILDVSRSSVGGLNEIIDGEIINLSLSNKDIKDVVNSLLEYNGSFKVLVKVLPKAEDFNKNIIVDEKQLSMKNENSELKTIKGNMFFKMHNKNEVDHDSTIFELFSNSLKNNAIVRNVSSYILENKNEKIKDLFSTGKIEKIITASKLKGQGASVLSDLWDKTTEMTIEKEKKEKKVKLNHS